MRIECNAGNLRSSAMRASRPKPQDHQDYASLILDTAGNPPVHADPALPRSQVSLETPRSRRIFF